MLLCLLLCNPPGFDSVCTRLSHFRRRLRLFHACGRLGILSRLFRFFLFAGNRFYGFGMCDFQRAVSDLSYFVCLGMRISDGLRSEAGRLHEVF